MKIPKTVEKAERELTKIRAVAKNTVNTKPTIEKAFNGASFPLKSSGLRRACARKDICPECGGDLDTGWECNDCRYDAKEEWNRRTRLKRIDSPLPVKPMAKYDAGLLNDYGGGNIEWWQDYIRAELGRAEEFYQRQFDTLQSALRREGE